MGAEIEEYKDGLDITGGKRLKGATIESYNDHRIAMAMAIAAMVAEGRTIINGVSSVNISFPGFFEMLRNLAKNQES
jgi:3-phosphoshikimate 1-carboxyvinyltransferase